MSSPLRVVRGEFDDEPALDLIASKTGEWATLYHLDLAGVLGQRNDLLVVQDYLGGATTHERRTVAQFEFGAVVGRPVDVNRDGVVDLPNRRNDGYRVGAQSNSGRGGGSPPSQPIFRPIFERRQSVFSSGEGFSPACGRFRRLVHPGQRTHRFVILGIAGKTQRVALRQRGQVMAD
ncbi:hypothetical protein [Enhygromyxa salina]|uniref:hypothetical protein n=1 Tax=Enhygromyxa salina TaxID=215803 RepID=UPI0006982F38|nr:hypothetical protein [Enhygromyxa salina]